MTDYSELKRLAEAATPGPWRGYKNSGYVYGPDVVVAKCGEFKDKELLRFNKERWGNDTAYIAAASPSVILAILAELEALRAEYREVSIRAGEWPCKCGWIHPKGVVPTHSCFDKPCVNPPPCREYRPKESA